MDLSASRSTVPSEQWLTSLTSCIPKMLLYLLVTQILSPFLLLHPNKMVSSGAIQFYPYMQGQMAKSMVCQLMCKDDTGQHINPFLDISIL